MKKYRFDKESALIGHFRSDRGFDPTNSQQIGKTIFLEPGIYPSSDFKYHGNFWEFAHFSIIRNMHERWIFKTLLLIINQLSYFLVFLIVHADIDSVSIIGRNYIH